MKRSITAICKPVEFAYVIKDIDVDKVMLEKYSVECRSDIESAWGVIQGQVTFPENDDKTMEIVLKDKISNVTFAAKAKIIEMVAKMGGKIVKDIKVEKGKGRSQKAYLTDIELFKEKL